MKKVIFFGSEVSGDETAFRVMELLKPKMKGKAELLRCESVYDIPEEGEVVIVDVVKGIEKVSVFMDIEAFSYFRSMSAHDLDLGTHLKIMKEMGWPLKVRIIGIPFGSKAEDVADDVRKELEDQLK
ncbi:MAG: hypothetical protein JW789_00825 [Candidatus Aenigmarchaeota archaeon]|nr:hypothetical protein [Candidatus Aenigmarchaeota archaeon]